MYLPSTFFEVLFEKTFYYIFLIPRIRTLYNIFLQDKQKKSRSPFIVDRRQSLRLDRFE